MFILTTDPSHEGIASNYLASTIGQYQVHNVSKLIMSFNENVNVNNGPDLDRIFPL